MYSNLEDVARKILVNELSLDVIDTNKIPEKTGMYFVLIKDDSLLDYSLSYKFNEQHILYIGISGNLRKRILKKHLGNSARSSTLRRSLGVIKKCEILSKNKFTPDDENRLTDWMKRSLCFCYCDIEANDIADIEKDLIKLYDPPLNLNHTDELSHNLSLRNMIKKGRLELRNYH